MTEMWLNEPPHVQHGRGRHRAPTLTRREQEVLELVQAGLTSGEIAAQLGLSPRSVDSVVHRARLRLGATTRLQAALLGKSASARATALGPPDATIDADLRALLNRLGDGATVAAAAADVGMSRRTASRRLAELRRLVGADSTTEAVLTALALLPAGPTETTEAA